MEQYPMDEPGATPTPPASIKMKLHVIVFWRPGKDGSAPTLHYQICSDYESELSLGDACYLVEADLPAPPDIRVQATVTKVEPKA